MRPGRLPREVAKDLAALQRYREQADYSTHITFGPEDGAEEVDRARRVVQHLRDLVQEAGGQSSGEPVP